ncbi:hypothetical protein [Paraburkholderia sp.]|uniref:hypothetical protein n=1 Tax=Paraburkholderia sp. TaxID=1926495 RepID=UPI00286F52F6|nr:hypothetical protein [Paraburkholderia sp.]
MPIPALFRSHRACASMAYCARATPADLPTRQPKGFFILAHCAFAILIAKRAMIGAHFNQVGS